jgi:hypothetical protein
MLASKVRVIPQLKMTNVRHGPMKPANQTPEVQEGIGHTNNWSGAVATNGVTSYGAGSFQRVFADWVVPVAEQAIGACTNGWDYSSSWVGIDGYGSGDVLQAGTEADALCFKSIYGSQIDLTNYYPWYEWYPNNSVQITNLPVAPGDDMFVHVWQTSSTQGNAYLVNQNTNQWVSIPFTAPTNPKTTLVGNSAEWIVERPTVNGVLTWLTNYTQDFFADGYAYTTSGAQYLPGSAGATQLEMVDSNGCVMSYPQLLGSGGIWFLGENSARFARDC